MHKDFIRLFCDFQKFNLLFTAQDFFKNLSKKKIDSWGFSFVPNFNNTKSKSNINV